MKLITLSNLLLIIALPFLVFSLLIILLGFDGSFYREKFLGYGVYSNVEDAESLHDNVIKFLKGNSNELPDTFNEREKQHFWDVRSIVRLLTVMLYALIALFIVLLAFSAFTLKVNNYITNFVGKVLLFGGILTIVLAAILFLLISSDFQSAFESFHKLFFEKGTYTFDSAKEIVVRLYPEQLFMDLGIRISAWVLIVSAALILLGIFLIFRSKKARIK
ncbi:DUF1461 domain-containing protein [Candidatus Woesearchaeota archaeon]|nr:DUF1461 domain-containing protein [Candidatus Woesearchaeota archaeon]